MAIKIINPIINHVEGGGASSPSVEPKYINFFDYDGTILYSYTEDELSALTELPPLPEHEGLICQGWNWTLADIKAEGKETDVGAMYITDDGASRIYINITDPNCRQPTLNFLQSVANGVTVDWGDGTEPETYSGTDVANKSHTYANIGRYVISLMPADGCIVTLGGATITTASYVNVIGTTNYIDRYKSAMIEKIECGKSCKLGNSCLNECYSARTITIPLGTTLIGGRALAYFSIKHVTIPTGATLGSYLLSTARALKSVSLPNGITSLPSNSITNCESLERLSLPNSVATISSNTVLHALKKMIMPRSLNNASYIPHGYATTSIIFLGDVTKVGAVSYGYGLRKVDFTHCTSVPTLSSSSAFQNCPSDLQIVVPDALYDAWVAATNWTIYASKITKASEVTE